MLNEALATELGLDPGSLRGSDGLRLLVGNVLPTAPLRWRRPTPATSWLVRPAPGDGRALLLGELVDSAGRVRDLHLKGSGRTPFARGGDGLAAVGPMLREYVVSEAMHALGIPTTRSLAVVATGRPVHRETVLPGAVLARVGEQPPARGQLPVRPGHRRRQPRTPPRRPRDHPAPRRRCGRREPLSRTVRGGGRRSGVARRQWMLVGFVHGVMNTDNMTISGETIDYGPCAFMEAFDPATVYSSIDEGGRYSYRNQPVVAEWNLARLAETLLPLFHDDQERRSHSPWSHSVGSAAATAPPGRPGCGPSSAFPTASTTRDLAAGRRLLTLLQQNHVDYTSFFRALGGPPAVTPSPCAACSSTSPRSMPGRAWRALGPDADAMDQVNPVYIPATTSSRRLSPPPPKATRSRRTAPGRGGRPLRRAAGPRAVRRPRPDDFGAYRTFCGT